MVIKYRDFLPNYLDGGNIRNHAEIIEKQDMIIEQKNKLLRNWNNLQPAILVERVCDDEDIKYRVHVVLDEYIEKIIIQGMDGKLVDDEFVFTQFDTTMEYHCEYIFPIEDGEYWNNPLITVKVVTFEGFVYEKGYPENDTVENNLFDHDENLDLVGALLGLNRRLYNSYNVEDGSLAEPSYMAKEVGDGIVLSCTEDDWYYRERLYYLLEHYQTMDLCQLFIYLIYNVELGISHDYEAYDIEQGNFIYVLERTTVFPINLDRPPIKSELSADEYLGRFVPLTREAYILTGIEYYSLGTMAYADGARDVYVTDMSGKPVCGLVMDMRTSIYGEDVSMGTITTNENGVFTVYAYEDENGVLRDIVEVYPVDDSYLPKNKEYHIPQSRIYNTFTNPSSWTNRSQTKVRLNIKKGSMILEPNADSICDTIIMHRDQSYCTPINLEIDGFNVQYPHMLIFHVDDETEYKHIIRAQSEVPDMLYVTPKTVYALKEGVVLREYSFSDEFKLGFKARVHTVNWWGPTSYIPFESPIKPTPVPAIEYGLGTDNPWTSALTNALIDNGRAWCNYTKTPAKFGGIPLTGDFEITLKIGLDALGGTGTFGLADNAGGDVFIANINNTINGTSVNTIFPSVNVDETITIKREGTTYTYSHSDETKTFTINNTDTLYLKLTKTGNGSLYVKNMTVTGGGGSNTL